MAITHTSRTGKIHFLHAGPKRGGGVRYFVSTQATGTLADCLPEGFEIHENVNGQVFLRRKQPKLIQDEEAACIADRLSTPRGGHLYKVEARGKTLTIFESADNLTALNQVLSWVDSKKEAGFREQFAYYQPVMRFFLVDSEQRRFTPERFCFRGSVEDWITIGPPGPIKSLAAKYLKHLGRESFFELF